MLQENILFANRYQLIKLLGRGGFSEVWLAKDNYTHLEIAIKVYAPGQGMDQDGLKDFCGELASVYDLNHSNLLKPQHVDTWNNMPYLIMAYCPAGSCVKQVGKMSETELWKLIHNVASGLAYLHDKEVIHQDIKPDNILVDAEGNYLITDFGISTRARSTLRKSIVGGNVSGGTTAYMGPERFSRQPAPTKASDIWSFGAMAFELLEGVTPFGEIGGGMQKTGAEIPFINAPVSDALKFVIFKMLSKETWDRPMASTLVEWANNPSAIQIDYSLLASDDIIPSEPQKRTQTNSQFEAKGTIQLDGGATQRFNSIESNKNMSNNISPSDNNKDINKTAIDVFDNTNNENSKKNNILKKVLITLAIICVFVFLMIFMFGLNTFGLGKSQEAMEEPKKLCDEALVDAKAHYDIGDYLTAKEYFQYVVDVCGADYQHAATWVNTCIEKEMSKKQMLDPIRWSLESKQDGENLTLIFKATIDNGWRLYGHKLPEGGPEETNISFDHIEGADLIGQFKSTSKSITQFDSIFALNLTWHEIEAVFEQKIKIIDENWLVVGSVSFMGSNSETVIMGPPFSFTVESK